MPKARLHHTRDKAGQVKHAGKPWRSQIFYFPRPHLSSPGLTLCGAQNKNWVIPGHSCCSRVGNAPPFSQYSPVLKAHESTDLGAVLINNIINVI